MMKSQLSVSKFLLK